MLARKALELIGMVEGSPDTPGSVSSAPTVVPESKPQVAMSAGSDLLALSRQLQLQQQQVQQQLEEVKQMKAAAPKAEIETQSVEDPEPIKAPGRKRPKAMSLAAEDVEATEASNEVAEVKVAKTSKTQSTKAVEAAQAAQASSVPKADGAKSVDRLEADEESHRMQAPKDFPAALRGGWQGLLAKKRAEGFKKPAKAEEHSSIMDLMQTPKTYTAWLVA